MVVEQGEDVRVPIVIERYYWVRDREVMSLVRDWVLARV